MPNRIKYYFLRNANIQIVQTKLAHPQPKGFHIRFDRFVNGECFRITREFLGGNAGKAIDHIIEEISELEFNAVE